MIYRYRLKECKENEGLRSRQIEGTTLYKKRWLYRETPLVIDSYLNLIEFEKAESEEEFQQRERKNKEEQTRIQREYGKQKAEGLKDKAEVINKKKELEEVFKKKENLTIYNMKKDQLLEYAKSKGFIKSELDGLKKQELIELLELEVEVG